MAKFHQNLTNLHTMFIWLCLITTKSGQHYQHFFFLSVRERLTIVLFIKDSFGFEIQWDFIFFFLQQIKQIFDSSN